MDTHAKGNSSERPKFSCPQISSSPNTRNDYSFTQSQNQSSRPSQVDSVGESHTTQPQISGLTEEEGRRQLEGLIKRSCSPVWAHYERNDKKCGVFIKRKINK